MKINKNIKWRYLIYFVVVGFILGSFFGAFAKTINAEVVKSTYDDIIPNPDGLYTGVEISYNNFGCPNSSGVGFAFGNNYTYNFSGEPPFNTDKDNYRSCVLGSNYTVNIYIDISDNLICRWGNISNYTEIIFNEYYLIEEDISFCDITGLNDTHFAIIYYNDTGTILWAKIGTLENGYLEFGSRYSIHNDGLFGGTGTFSQNCLDANNMTDSLYRTFVFSYNIFKTGIYRFQVRIYYVSGLSITGFDEVFQIGQFFPCAIATIDTTENYGRGIVFYRHANYSIYARIYYWQSLIPMQMRLSTNQFFLTEDSFNQEMHISRLNNTRAVIFYHSGFNTNYLNIAECEYNDTNPNYNNITFNDEQFISDFDAVDILVLDENYFMLGYGNKNTTNNYGKVIMCNINATDDFTLYPEVTIYNDTTTEEIISKLQIFRLNDTYFTLSYPKEYITPSRAVTNGFYATNQIFYRSHILELSFGSNSSGSWITYNKQTINQNGTYFAHNNNFTDYDTTYYWIASVFNYKFYNDYEEYYFRTADDEGNFLNIAGFDFSGNMMIFFIWCYLLWLWFKAKSEDMTYYMAMLFIPYTIFFIWYALPLYDLMRWEIVSVFGSLAVCVGGFTFDTYRKRWK